MILQTIHSKLNKIEELRNEVKNAYVEINKLEKEIIEEWLENKDLKLESDKNYYQMLWIYNKEIDYKKLEQEYPEIYILGLRPTFSKEHLFHSVDKDMANKILRKYTYDLSEYKLKKEGRNKYGK